MLKRCVPPWRAIIGSNLGTTPTSMLRDWTTFEVLKTQRGDLCLGRVGRVEALHPAGFRSNRQKAKLPIPCGRRAGFRTVLCLARISPARAVPCHPRRGLPLGAALGKVVRKIGAGWTPLPSRSCGSRGRG